MLRQDISAAIQTAPNHIQSEIETGAATALELLNTYLPLDEPVANITSVSPAKDGPNNSILTITNQRLIFVAPAPQAVAWRLASLTKSQAFAGYFFLEGDAGEYSLGLTTGAWATDFERMVKRAAALAVLERH